MQLADVLRLLDSMPPDKRAAVVQEAERATAAMLWVANPGPQRDAYESKADELFYGGQAGGGKSELGLGIALNTSRSALILREYKDDARALGERLCQIIGSATGWNRQQAEWRVDGRIFEFDGLPNEKDKERHKGRPHDLYVFDELGDFYESQYEFIIAWNRSTVPGQRCRVVATGNPPTRSKGLWVIKRWGAWLDPAHPRYPYPDGKLLWYLRREDGAEQEVDGPGPYEIAGKETYARSRTFIRSRLEDNPELAETGYDATLARLPKELRDAYREGRFDASLRDAPHQVIPTAWVIEAQKRWTAKPPRGVRMSAIGVDPAGGGNDEVTLARRHDGWFDEIIAKPAREVPLGRDIAGLVITNRRNEADVCVDMGGGYGGSTWEHLDANGIKARAYKGAEGTKRRTADGKLGFTNLRSAAYWKFREALDPGQEGGSPVALPPDSQLLGDLTALTFEVTPHGVKVLPKEKVVEALGRSPDRGDAVVMCWDTGPAGLRLAGDIGPEQGIVGRGGRTPRVDHGPRRRGRR